MSDPTPDPSRDQDIKILPLIRRHIFQRLDIYPFLLGYSLLILTDVSSSNFEAVVDAVYLSLLALQLLLFLKCQWDPEWRATVAFRSNVGSTVGIEGSKIELMSRWTHCLLLPTQTHENVRESGGIVPVFLERTEDCTVAVVHFRGLTYRCCANTNSGDADVAMESIWKNEIEEIDEDAYEESAAVSWGPHFHRLHFPIDLPLNFYTSWSGHDSNKLLETRQIYGRNITHIPLPSILSLLLQQLLQPLFLFQLFCVILWSLDEYWMYALFTLFSLIMFEFTMAYNRWKGVKRLREEVAGSEDDDDAVHKPIPLVECFRNGNWFSLPCNQLVVGDIVSLVSSSGQQLMMMGHDHELGTAVPADLLLLNGRAVVNEAMLTGESVPQVKESIRGDISSSNGKSEKTLDLSREHKRSVLFSGTVLMDHHSEEEICSINKGVPLPPNKGLICFVLRTGFDTAQGSLLRSLAYRAESGGGNAGGGEGVNSIETYIFLALLLLFALISASTIVQHAWGDVTRNHFKLVLHVIIIITSVIPPELPMELSLAVTTSLSELVKRCNVHCTEPVSDYSFSTFNYFTDGNFKQHHFILVSYPYSRSCRYMLF